MDRFFSFWRKYAPVSKISERFIKEHAKIICYKKNSYFSRYHEVRPYWCFLLNGVVSASLPEENGQERIVWITISPDYFTGTKHIFSNHGEGLDIKFITRSEIVVIPQEQMRYAQQQLSDISELMQILKQRKLALQQKVIEMSKTHYGIERYLAFRNTFPVLTLLLTTKQVSQFLNIGIKTVNRGKSRYLKKHKRE